MLPMRIEEMYGVGGRLHFHIAVGLTSWGRFSKRRNGFGWIWPEGFSMEEIAGLVDRLGDVYDMDPDNM